MLEQLRKKDVVVVWKLDRLTRSLKDLLYIMERVDAAGAGFRSLTEPIDTTTSAGRMLMQMVGSFAEFERAMIRERTRAGLIIARKEGRVGGRPPKLAAKQRTEVIAIVRSGTKICCGDCSLVSCPSFNNLSSPGARGTSAIWSNHASRAADATPLVFGLASGPMLEAFRTRR